MMIIISLGAASLSELMNLNKDSCNKARSLLEPEVTVAECSFSMILAAKKNGTLAGGSFASGK